MCDLKNLFSPNGGRFTDHPGIRFLLVIAALLLVPVTAAAEEPEDTFGQDAEARAHAYMAQEPPEWDAARAAFAEAAKQGSPRAMSYLGWMYEGGHGVARDGELAAKWYGRAARAGAHDFAVKLGWMYLGGDGVDRDRDQAEFWFRYAIEAGHAPAQVAWASVLIADAQGGRDPERVFEAQELLEEALEEGLMLASYFLARLYIEGIGTQSADDALAAHYTRIGADDGHGQMQGWLAFMYVNGQGVDRDLVTAAKWANLAAANGDSLGHGLRLMLDEQLAPEQVREARQRAVDWALGQH
ncbi:tetratricopeptide repeat protein [Thioalkalivibrio sp.]|uniref:tetratricopeptide repeat protein n=1 Tax=Thioalkalivibrio sp. TaxID=2093813 RepID=UPI0012D5CAFD|nr:tetratricopeptide repeat protein [Thioalkalivibrio sp.]TVP82520.1 MAG: sel1 repeat family protein [Thioalkalivibrio sp.]